MSKIGKNIQKIRKVKKLSQTAFSELFGLSRTSVGAYEEGRAEPKTDTIIQIAKYFGLSIDALLTNTIAVNDLYKFSKYDDKFLTDKIDSTEKTYDYVVLEAVLPHYIDHIGEEEFLSGLPVFSLSFLELNNSRIFQSGTNYFVCTPYQSGDNSHSYLEVTNKGIRVSDSVPQSNKDSLEIWSVQATIASSNIAVSSGIDRISLLEKEVEEIKEILREHKLD